MESWPAVPVPALPGPRPGLPVRVWDTATEELRPLAPGDTVRLYVCGITPYDATHLGHAATYLAYDMLIRTLRDGGQQVDYCQNVTDVDDPLLDRATATGEDWRQLAQREIALFRADMAALRVLPPNHYVGAVEAIPLVIAMIEKLTARGAAYPVDGDLYFSVAAAPRLGEVSHLPYDSLLELARQRGGDPDRPGKKDPLDPLLWRAERPGEPSWPAPFGPGRPGWHVECAAISVDRLGPVVDVQGGGRDLAFPHHELGAAQVAVVTGGWPAARAYVHTGMVGYAGEKMSKSRGNLVLVSDLLRGGTDPMALRLALLAQHYRTDWEYHADLLAGAEVRLARWREAVALPAGPPVEPFLAHLRRHLADNLDAPAGLADVDRWASEALTRAGRDPYAPAAARDAVDALLGIAL
ncbi:MAG: cysteine--1-D-myo-inosityl 2-amino-2-deoxy-alpha-D-glucopyranoside ligase [Mycobacteriales bacterium]